MGDSPAENNENADNGSSKAQAIPSEKVDKDTPPVSTAPATPPATLPPPYTAFSPRRRSLILGIVTAAGFFGPLSGGIYLPALLLFSDVFSASATVVNATVSVYMLFFAVAPLGWAAFADYGGRKPVYLASFAIFNLANVLLAALPPNIGALFFLRILQAIGSCAVAAIGAGTVADVIEPRKRARAMSIFILGPNVGPILGPLIGGQLAVESRWRWIFGFLAIVSIPIYCMILFCLPETLRSLVGDGTVHAERRWIFLPKLRQAQVVDNEKYPRMPRPTPKAFYRLLKYPPNFVVTVSNALLFAAFYGVLITFPRVLQGTYGFSEAEVGYAYLCPGIATMVGSTVGGKLSDLRRKRAVEKMGADKVLPERRIRPQIYMFLLCAAGTCMYGWLAHFEIHASAVLVSSAITSLPMGWIFVTSLSYQTESFRAQVASLVALAGLLRNLAAAISALLIEPLIGRIGLGWCFTGLSLLIVLLCVPGVLWIVCRGPRMRERMLERLKREREVEGVGR